MGAALQVDWPAIQRAFEVGASLEQIAATFGVAAGTVKKRAQRYDWLSPDKMQKALESGSGLRVSKVSQKGQNAPKKQANRAVAEALVATWAEKGAAHRNLIFNKAHEAIKKATLPVISKWSDMQIADTMARKAANLESAETQINIAVLPSGWPKPASENGGWSGQTVDVATDENAEGPELLDSEPSEG